MEVQKYVDQKKKSYNLIFSFLINENSTNSNILFQNFVESQNYSKEKEEFLMFLRFLSKIAKNHCRFPAFNSKIERLLKYYSDQMKQTFTNSEIFQIFKHNKLILLFLFKQNIISADETIVHNILDISAKYDVSTGKEEDLNSHIQNLVYIEFPPTNEQSKPKSIKQFIHYAIYFYPEIKKYLDEKDILIIDEELIKQGFGNQEIFEEKRLKGENDNLLCEIIREDSVNKFNAYVNQNKLQLNKTKIKPSIFETHSFLIGKEPTLIEYAAFFGSTQIFHYLLNKRAEYDKNLWLYAIHGNNQEIIHFLVENHVKPDINECIKESIKCHHNDIANSLTKEENEKNKMSLYDNGVHYMNYCFFPSNFKNNDIFYYFCKYGYYQIVDIYFKSGIITLKTRISNYDFDNEILF